MRTVIENKIGLNKNYVLENTEIPYYQEKSYNVKSCFYDFGAKQNIQFSNNDNEIPSNFVESLKKSFFS